MPTETLRPSAAGDRAEWFDSGFAKVSDVSDLTFIITLPDSISIVKDLYNIPDTLHTVISSVDFYVRVKSTSATYKNYFAHFLKTHGVEYEGIQFQEGTAFADHVWTLAVNPNTGLAWTQAEVNALQIGVRSATRKVVLAYYVGFCSEIRVVVNYIVPASALIAYDGFNGVP